MKRVFSLILVLVMLLAVFPVTAFAAGNNTITMDFKAFAKDASTQSWWNDFDKAANVEGVFVGCDGMERWTDKEILAYRSMIDYQKKNYDWYVDDAATGLEGRDGNLRNKKAFWLVSDDEIPFGMSFFSYALNDAASDFAFNLIVEESGMYNMRMEGFYEAPSAGCPMMMYKLTGSNDVGSGYVDILVNGKIVLDDYNEVKVEAWPNGSFSIIDPVNSTVRKNIGEIYLKKGVNSIRIRPAKDMLGVDRSHRRWISLNSLTFEKIGSCHHNVPDCTVCGSSGQYEMLYNNKIHDLFAQPVSITEGEDTEVQIRVNHEGPLSEKLWLSQNAATAVELKNGAWVAVKPGEVFKPGRDIYFLTVNEETGEVTSQKTRLNILGKAADGELMPDGGVEGMNFKLGKEFGFTVPDVIPVFGGTDIQWEFDFIPISVEYDREDDNKINVVFGTKIAKSDGEEDQYFKDFDFKEYKKDIKKVSSKQGRTLKQLKNDFKMSNAQSMNLFGGKVVGGGSGQPSFDFDVAGYAEMKVIDGKLTFVEGQLCLEAEISYTYEGQLFIWVVPIVYEIGGGIGAGFEGNMLNIDPESFIPEFEAYLTAKIKAIVGAGIGVAKVASVGASGTGSLNLKSALHEEYMKAWGEGEADFHVKVFGKKVASKVFAKGDFLIYETGNPDGLISAKTLARTAARTSSLYAGVRNDGVYENESRIYLENPTEWYGSYPPVSLMAVDYTNKNLQLLAENVYTESAPIVCDIDGQKVMVMLWDDEARADIDRTMLVWSMYDEENGTWSEPEAIHNDGTADFHPDFKDGWVVWQNQKTGMDDTMTLEEIATLGEISAAKWNGAGFDEPVAVTNNETMDTLPAVCANGEEVTVAWLTNTENDILGISGTNTVNRMVLGDEVQTVASDLPAVTDLAAGNANGTVQIIYTLDADNDLETLEDRELYLNGEQITDNEVLDSNPVFVGEQLYYYSGGNVVIRDLSDGAEMAVFAQSAPGLTDTFTAAASESGEAAIWWSGAVEGGAEIFCTLNTDGTWSEVIELTEAGNQCRYPTGMLEEDGSMYLAFCNSIWEDGDIAQNDLYTLQVSPSYDLSVENVYVDETTMKVYATVKNNGELPVESYTVSLTDTALNNELTVEEPLKAGATADVEIEYIVPENMDKRAITFAVSSDAEEFDLDNNEAVLTVGNCDVEVIDIEVYETLPEASVVATVTNTGCSDSGEVTVFLRKETEDGEVVATQTVENLRPDENKAVTLIYDAANAENALWYVTAEADAEEMTDVNNAEYFVNEYINTVDAYSHDIVRYEQKEETLIVNAYAENNTDGALDADAVLVVYHADGTVKAAVSKTVVVPAYDSIDILFEVPCTLEADDTMNLLIGQKNNAVSNEDKTHNITVECVCGDTCTIQENCTFEEGSCVRCGFEMETFSISGTNMTLGNELELNIMLPKSTVDAYGKDLIVTVIHHEFVDGDTEYTFKMSELPLYGGNRYYKASIRVAAAQMTDLVDVIVTDEDGNVYSNEFTTSVLTYVTNNLDKQAAKVKTLLVDMVNYGAAAQDNFSYRQDLYANSNLTDDQKLLATGDVTCTDIRVKGDNYVGSNLSLQDCILLNFMFTGVADDVRETMYATVSFTGVLGNEVNVRVPVEKLMTRYAGVAVNQIVLADAVTPVTVTLYNADGSVYGYATDSVESYNARQNPNGDNALYTNIMKFAASAYAYKK